MLLKTQERKQNTRRKIQLGGLIKKAGLENEPTAVLYGMLLEAKESLETIQQEKLETAGKLKAIFLLILVFIRKIVAKIFCHRFSLIILAPNFAKNLCDNNSLQTNQPPTHGPLLFDKSEKHFSENI